MVGWPFSKNGDLEVSWWIGPWHGLFQGVYLVFGLPKKNTFPSPTAVQELSEALNQIDALEKELAAAEEQVVWQRGQNGLF